MVTAPGFDPGSATAEELTRWEAIENAVDGFAQTIASVVAHESGHLLGLVAHGPTPAGLYGGTSRGQDRSQRDARAGPTPPRTS